MSVKENRHPDQRLRFHSVPVRASKKHSAIIRSTSSEIGLVSSYFTWLMRNGAIPIANWRSLIFFHVLIATIVADTTKGKTIRKMFNGWSPVPAMMLWWSEKDQGKYDRRYVRSNYLDIRIALLFTWIKLRRKPRWWAWHLWWSSPRRIPLSTACVSSNYIDPVWRPWLEQFR